MGRRVTLKQVAANAGVSYQTVSKVLNKQIKVTKETEQRILDSVQALGYRPNILARSLRSQRSHLIGYSWAPTPPGQVNPILDQFLQSMVQAAENAGYHLLTFPYRAGDQVIDAYKDLIETNRVDAFVLSSVEFDDPRIQYLRQVNFPFVAFGRSNSDWDIPFVDIDGGAGMQMVVGHLVEQGHKRIAALVWPTTSRVGQNRMEGLQLGLQRAGIQILPQFIAEGEGVYTFGYQATARWLEQPGERPTAIIAFNDAMAIGAMHAILDHGLQVGGDIAVTGFDDTPMIQYLTPPLTSVRQPIWEVGQSVMAMMLERLNAGEADTARESHPHLLITPRLIVRASSTGWTGEET